MQHSSPLHRAAGFSGVRFLHQAVRFCAGLLGSQALAEPGPVLQLESQRLSEVPLSESVNPLSVSSPLLFGGGRGLLDTPRAVSVITPALYSERGIDGLADLVGFAAGATAPGRYGRPSVPNIRGDTAETYWNGQRRSNNLFGYFPSFNGVEAVEIVRGPGSALLGPAQASGGFVNYLPKSPNLERPHTILTARLGTWVPDQPSLSHFNGSAQLDVSRPISRERALRLSYEAKGGETFHRRLGVTDNRQDVYLAHAWAPGNGVTWDLNAQFLWQDTPQLNGVNRPTPELVETGRYFTGPLGSPASGTQRDALSPVDGSPVAVLQPTGTVLLPADAVLFSKGDTSNAAVAHLQSVLRTAGTGPWSFTHRSFAEHVDRTRYHEFEYTEAVRQWTLEHRSEGRWEPADSPVKGVTAAAGVRWERREAEVNYYNEFIHAFDVTDARGSFSAADAYPLDYFPGSPGRSGRLFFGAAEGTPESTRSELLNPSASLLAEVGIPGGLRLDAGIRADLFAARARDSLGDRNRWGDSLTDLRGSGHISLTRKLGDNLTGYLTLNRVNEINASVTGGGLLLFADPSDPSSGALRKSDFRGVGLLGEAGLKLAAWDNRLFSALAVYRQTRSRPSFGGTRDRIEVEGIEWETTWQPDRDFNLVLTASVQDGRHVDSAPAQLGGRSIYDSYALGSGPGGKGTGLGYDFFFLNQVPEGDYRLTGFSAFLGSVRVSRRIAGGFGAALSSSFQSGQRGNLDDEFRLPAAWEHDLSLFWRGGRLEINLDVLNLSDDVRWIHNGDPFMNNALLTRSLPRRLELWAKLRF